MRVAVVGGGIVGLGIARAGAAAGLDTVVLERAALGGVATRVSGAIVRTHYDNPAEAVLALEGLRSFERFEEDIGGDAGFRRTGFATIPGPDEVASGDFARRVEMLRRTGIDTELVDGAGLSRLFPAMSTDGVTAAAIEPRSGYADPSRTVDAVAAAARRAGATMREGVEARSLLADGDRVAGVLTDEGPVRADAVVLACGAWAVRLAAGVGLDLPIRPTAAVIARFAHAGGGAFPTVIDVPNGVYFRQDGPRHAIGGRRDWADRPITAPDGPLPEVSAAFADDVRSRVARRLAAAGGWRGDGGRSGPLDMTPDARPLLGPSGVEGLWLSVGWSGTGFKTAVPAGEALVRWMVDGRPARAEYADLRPDRPQAHGSGPRTPH
ncbi:MAG: NAD(P)/FAD-dependent oxidoreductase [Miltoncostaeaceae bacterium]